MGPAVLQALWPKLPLGQALLYHKQDAGCIYVNNVVPWNTIRYVHYHGTDQPFYAFTVPITVLFLPHSTKA